MSSTLVSVLFAERSVSDGQLAGPFSKDVWELVLGIFFVDAASPMDVASRRMVAALVCRSWANMPLPYLKFVLANCRDVHLHIRMSFLNVHSLHGRRAGADDISSWIDELFTVVGPVSDRWRSFDFETDHRHVFSCVQSHCRELSMPAISVLRLSYTYLSGYYFYFPEQPRPPDPLVGDVWFRSRDIELTELALDSVPLSWSGDIVFDRLERVEFSDADGLSPFMPQLLQALFDVATGLMQLRLGLITAFDPPKSYRLYSSGLVSLDIDFDSGLAAQSVLSALVAPRLSQLTVREVHNYVYCLLACPDVLQSIRIFTVYGPWAIVPLCRRCSALFRGWFAWTCHIPVRRCLQYIMNGPRIVRCTRKPHSFATCERFASLGWISRSWLQWSFLWRSPV
ncbi:hypothetical protein B0H13DRAFT_1050059 [Mycena leptocephala]|nr:hypothetical protein B0H13DRAFT_1050059 [Mycena leptocephala]